MVSGPCEEFQKQMFFFVCEIFKNLWVPALQGVFDYRAYVFCSLGRIDVVAASVVSVLYPDNIIFLFQVGKSSRHVAGIDVERGQQVFLGNAGSSQIFKI